ncbi:MAG: TMEM143 family protein [Hyphomicrobium sp.]
MSSAHASPHASSAAIPAVSAGTAPYAAAPGAPAADVVAAETKAVDAVLKIDDGDTREKFIPVTRFALMDRLTLAAAWSPGQAQEVRRFFRYLDYWRQQKYSADLLELEQTYEPFNPDTDLLLTRKFSDAERLVMQKRVITQMTEILNQANYRRIDPTAVELIMTRETHYGLDLHVDFGAFDECLIYYRGASKVKGERRNIRKFLRKEEFEVPIFQRLFLLFKLKPFEARVKDEMARDKITREEAEKRVKRLRALLPAQVKEGNIYMKLFKNIPRSDIEMVFPNTQVKFRLMDKVKLGVTTTGGLGMGAIGAAGKLALVASNPIAAAGAVFGLGTIAFRQAMNFMNQKQRYMVVMAQNLYFHAMADNRGVMLKLADRAAEEDVKEEMLLYTVLLKERARHRDMPAIDAAIEQYLYSSFGIEVNFDLEDALRRLMADGLVTESTDGFLHVLPPQQASAHLDEKWDRFLDELPDTQSAEGFEFDGLNGKGAKKEMGTGAGAASASFFD